MCLHKALNLGVRSCSWKPSGQLDLSHTKSSAHDSPFCISLTFLLPSTSASSHFYPVFFLASYTSLSFPPLYLFYPTAFFPLFLSQKVSYSLMHGSCREQCYFIFPWQRSLCFSRSHFSFGSNVLCCQC